MDTAWAGQAPEQIQRTVPHIEVVEPHGILYTIVKVFPGGELGVVGVFLFGLLVIGWLKFHKQIREMLRPRI